MRYSTILIALGAAACASTPAPVAAPPAPVPAPAAVQPPPPVVQPPPPAAQPAPPAAPFNPEGYYELQIAFGGQSAPLAVELWRENGQWRGTAGVQGLGSADLSSLVQDGRKIKLTVVAQGGPSFVINLDVKTDNTVTGEWTGNGDGSRITGKKTK